MSVAGCLARLDLFLILGFKPLDLFNLTQGILKVKTNKVRKSIELIKLNN